MTTKGVRDLYVMVFLCLQTREAIVTGSTERPNSAWVCEQTLKFLEQSSPGTQDSGAGLYRIEVTIGPGSGGVKILNTPAPPGFCESVKVGEQNLYNLGKKLVGDRDPRSHEFNIQMRAMGDDRSGIGVGQPSLVALASSLLERSTTLCDRLMTV